MSADSRQGALHHRHRLPRRRQDDAHPPSAGRPPAGGASRSSSTSSAMSASTARSCASCGIESCPEENIVELANGCICCTVADDFVPAIEPLLARADRPSTSSSRPRASLCPSPWSRRSTGRPIRSRVTVDGVDRRGRRRRRGRRPLRRRSRGGSRAARGGSARSTTTIRSRRSSRTSSSCADLVVLNKTDLLDDGRADASAATSPQADAARRQGRARPSKAGIDRRRPARPRRCRRGRPRRRDLRTTTREEEHDHDDFESFVLEMPVVRSPRRS